MELENLKKKPIKTLKIVGRNLLFSLFITYQYVGCQFHVNIVY